MKQIVERTGPGIYVRFLVNNLSNYDELRIRLMTRVTYVIGKIYSYEKYLDTSLDVTLIKYEFNFTCGYPVRALTDFIRTGLPLS